MIDFPYGYSQVGAPIWYTTKTVTSPAEIPEIYRVQYIDIGA